MLWLNTGANNLNSAVRGVVYKQDPALFIAIGLTNAVALKVAS